jgi:hypothetical protein
MADKVICPICKTKAQPLDKVGDAAGFECATHERFRVVDSVFAIPALCEAPREKWEAALRRAKQRQPGERAPMIETYDFDQDKPSVPL